MNVVSLRAKQEGAALIIFLSVIALAFTAYVLKQHNPATLKAEQDKKTEIALAKAKQALLAYAAEPITGVVNGAPLTCGLNCARPGDLPCPDTNNDGEAETLCGANQTDRLGRLPWKTLGIGDIRDGAGERLWYAVSTRYKINPRILPLNNQTFGTINLKNAMGISIYNASATTGLAAVIISPGLAITRSTGLTQDRSSVNQNNPVHYLDIALGEDNADFSDTNPANGFIAGPIKTMQSNQMVIVSNDIVLPITRDEMNAAMELRVLLETMQAINYFYSVKGTYPAPANLADLTCLNSPIVNDNSNANCAVDTLETSGRVPVGESATPPSTDIWASVDTNSMLRGENNHNWFQQNGWRAQVQLQKNLPCAIGEKRCRNIDVQTTIRITN